MKSTKKSIKTQKKKKGFTLIELVIVIAIIGILTAIAMPKFGNAHKSAKINADIASAKAIANATDMLISRGEIIAADSPSGEHKYEVNKEIVIGKEGSLGKTISDQLQNVPKPKAVTGDFYVIIDGDDNVIVEAGANKFVVYPEDKVKGDKVGQNPYAKR